MTTYRMTMTPAAAEALTERNESRHRSVTERGTQAYWYAVGHADATGQPDLSEEFRTYAMAEAAEATTFLPCIPDQWKAFLWERATPAWLNEPGVWS